MKVPLFVKSSIILTFVTFPVIAGPVRYDSIISELEKTIPVVMQQQKIPGLAIALVGKNSFSWSKGFGVTNEKAKHKVRVNSETTFSAQSISKYFTALAIMRAVQDGILDLDTPITEYVPTFTVHSTFEEHPEKKITLRHLLTHTAGFTHEAPVGNNFDSHSPSFLAHVNSISQTWLRFRVGSRYAYSNLGIDLAGYILTLRSGLPFEKYLDEKLLRPIGMHKSTFALNSIKTEKNRAIGHSKALKAIPLEVAMIPSGGLYTNANDLLSFLRFNIAKGQIGDNVILSRANFEETQKIPEGVEALLGSEAPRQGYGLGVGAVSMLGTRCFVHLGGGFGFRADLAWCPSLEIGVAILTNTLDQEIQGKLSRTILEKLSLGAGASKLTTEAPSERRMLLGNYIGYWGSNIDLVYDGATFYMSFDGSCLYPLIFDNKLKGHVNMQTEKVKLEFVMSDDKQANYLKIGPHINDLLTAEGVSSYDFNGGPFDQPGSNKAHWKQYVGAFRMAQGPFFRPELEQVHIQNGYLYFNNYRLHEHESERGLFFMPNGETVDFRKIASPTFRNIKLAKQGTHKK